MPDFKNKVSLITGAGSGIGAATALHFATCGSSLALNDMNADTLQVTAEACLQAGLKKEQVLCIPGNITGDKIPKELIQKTINHFGKLDILVNCVGIFRESAIDDESVIDTYDLIMNVNLKAMYVLIQEAIPFLKKTKGNVVSVSSCVSARASPKGLAYSVSKAGVDQVTRNLALDLGEFQIRVNSVNPGAVRTNLLRGYLDQQTTDAMFTAVAEKHVLKRIAEPIEIAKPIAFLASDDASFVTGANFYVDGGMSLNLMN